MEKESKNKKYLFEETLEIWQHSNNYKFSRTWIKININPLIMPIFSNTQLIKNLFQ